MRGAGRQQGIAEAIRSLAANGHRRIAYVAGPPESWMSAAAGKACRPRASGPGWKRCGLSPPSRRSPAAGRLARDVLASGATAVLTYNDLLAIGLMQELQAAAVVVPDRISIVGFDDIFGADFTTPPLTTVRSPMAECGTEAAGLLLDALQAAANLRRPSCGWRRSSCCAAPAAGFFAG